MAQRERALLRKWFSKGCYPTAAQFSDWLDSFWHKAEKIAISSIEELDDRLNQKYEASAGEELERKNRELEQKIVRHEEVAETNFTNLFTDIEELEAEDERLAGDIAGETARATGEEAAIRREFADADGREQVAREQKDAETLQAAKDYTDSVRHAVPSGLLQLHLLLHGSFFLSELLHEGSLTAFLLLLPELLQLFYLLLQ